MTLQEYKSRHAAFNWHIPEEFNFGADVVDRWAREANGPALIWCNEHGEERRYDFSDISRVTAKLADGLRQRGVHKGDRVLVMLPRIPEWQMTMVACLKLGAIPIPCIEMLTSKDIAYRIKHAQVRAVVARAEHSVKFKEVLEDIAVRISVGNAGGWEPWDEVTASGNDSFTPAVVAAEDPAILYYTSGSSGDPKGVLHASRALYAWREVAKTWLDLGRDDIIWCTADTGWSKAGTSTLFGPWSLGACSFFYDGPFNARERLRLLSKHCISVYCAPGTELYRLVDEDVSAYRLDALRHVVSAGESLNEIVAKRWTEATGLSVAEAYGQTETLMTLINPAGVPVKVGSMGVANHGSVIDVLDVNGNRVADGVEGDVALLSPNPQLMIEYWSNSERTLKSYLTAADGRRWFITGDRATRDADGYFYYTGRSDDVINSAGYRIGPSEVENALLEHEGVLEVAVIGVHDAERGEVVKAFVVLRDGLSPSDALKKELQDHVKTRTAPYKYPRIIDFISAIPKTMTGKIQRAALRNLEREKALQAR